MRSGVVGGQIEVVAKWASVRMDKVPKVEDIEHEV